MIYFSIRKSKLRYNKLKDYSEVSRNLIRFQIICFGSLRFSFMILFQRSLWPNHLLSSSKKPRRFYVCVTPSHKNKRDLKYLTKPVDPEFGTSDTPCVTMITLLW